MKNADKDEKPDAGKAKKALKKAGKDIHERSGKKHREEFERLLDDAVFSDPKK